MTYKQAVNQFIKIGLTTYLLSPIIFYVTLLIISSEKSEVTIYFLSLPLIIGIGAIWIPYALILGGISKLVNRTCYSNFVKKSILLIMNLFIQNIIFWLLIPQEVSVELIWIYLVPWFIISSLGIIKFKFTSVFNEKKD